MLSPLLPPVWLLQLPVRPAREDESKHGAGSHGQAPNKPHAAPLSLLGETGGPLLHSATWKTRRLSDYRA